MQLDHVDGLRRASGEADERRFTTAERVALSSSCSLCPSVGHRACSCAPKRETSVWNLANDAARIARRKHAFRNIARHDAARADHRPGADSHARQDNRAASNPDV